MAEWIAAFGDAELADGSRRLVRARTCDIAVFRVQGTVYAIDDSCPHNGASLAGGKLEGTSVACRAHGLRFDLATGCMRGPAGLRARTFPVRLHDGRIEIDVAAPAPQAQPLT